MCECVCVSVCVCTCVRPWCYHSTNLGLVVLKGGAEVEKGEGRWGEVGDQWGGGMRGAGRPWGL